MTELSPRRAIVELAHYVTSEGRGTFGHPVQQAVVEGRQYPPDQPGTSCVELPDCVAFAAGCRADCINRDEHHGRRVQRDLGWYLHGSKHDGTILDRPTLLQLRPGDFLGYDFDRGGHAAVYLGQLADGRVLTADFGQYHGGGKLYECSVNVYGGFLALRGRRVWAAVSTGTLSFPGPTLTVAEWCAAHALLDPGPVLPADYLTAQWDEL